MISYEEIVKRINEKEALDKFKNWIIKAILSDDKTLGKKYYDRFFQLKNKFVEPYNDYNYWKEERTVEELIKYIDSFLPEEERFPSNAGLEDQIKKEKLLAQLKRKKEINEETLGKVKIMMSENNIHWNEDWFWCFRILHSSQIMFLCENMENPAFITKTLEMRKRGLPDDYYIIDQKNGYYLCC